MDCHHTIKSLLIYWKKIEACSLALCGFILLCLNSFKLSNSIPSTRDNYKWGSVEQLPKTPTLELVVWDQIPTLPCFRYQALSSFLKVSVCRTLIR